MEIIIKIKIMELKDKIEQARNIERKMSMDELNDDVIDLLLKYSSGTSINNIIIDDFKMISHLIEDIIKNPFDYIQKEKN